MFNRFIAGTVFLAMVLVFWADSATAFFHNYRINELYSNADGSIQFIELINGNLNGEMFSAGQKLTAIQGGVNHSFTFPTNLPSFATANTSVLLATQGFADLAIVTPDFIIPAGFLFTDGGTLDLGTAVFDSITYAPLPTSGNLSMNRDGTTGVNSPKNFAGNTGTIPAATAVALDVGVGWNLVSSVVAVAVDVTFGDPGVFASVWKWENGTWAVYLPGEKDSGAYATSKGFVQLATISPGEGFWVNANSASALMIQGTPVFGDLSLVSGWNLLGLKSDQSATVADFIAGKAGVVSLWKWANGTWAVYLPGETDHGAAFAASKGFVLLTTLAPGEGFWVNNP